MRSALGEQRLEHVDARNDADQAPAGVDDRKPVVMVLGDQAPASLAVRPARR